jgi:hypothetical protein
MEWLASRLGPFTLGGKKSPVTIEIKADWAEGHVWTLWSRDKSFSLSGSRTPSLSLYSHIPASWVKYSCIKKKLHGLSPLANYTDRATASCRRSDCQLFADRRCHVVSVTDPYGLILGFLDRSRYFHIK